MRWKRWGSWVAVALVVIGYVFILAASLARAHDMNDPDAEWFQSLHVPGVPGTGLAGTSCCNGGKARDADCKNVDTRERNGHLEAWADSKTFPDSVISPIYGHAPNTWVSVPDNVIIHGRNNPTGRDVGCWYNGGWRCFVEGVKA